METEKCAISNCTNPAICHHRDRKKMGGGKGGEEQPLCWPHHIEAHHGTIKFYEKHGIITCSEKRWELLKQRFGIE